jgi:hypothetical protein
MRNLAWVFVVNVTIGICAITLPARAAVIRACQVENPPENCKKMWAIVAHVRLPSAAPYDQTLCAPVIATVPAYATVRGFRFRASDENLGEMGCTRSTMCPIGYCRFVHGYGPPQETLINRVTVYTTIFQNWSTDWAREGRLIIFFEMPAGKVPLEHL